MAQNSKTNSKKNNSEKTKGKSAKSKKNSAGQSEAVAPSEQDHSLLEQLRDYTGLITRGLMDAFLSGSAIPLVYSDSWLAEFYLKTLDPHRARAMREAGEFLKDAREVAGLSVSELSQALGLKDTEIIEKAEGGNAMLPFDIVLRMTSLLARHDPIPFMLKFLRTYNPGLEKHMDNLGVSKVPRHFERERRLINIYRKRDVLRDMSDELFDHLVDYQERALDLALQIIEEERTGPKAKRASGKK